MVRAALIAFLTAGLVASSCDDAGGPASTGEPVQVVEVFDGDSFAVEDDEVRMLGINAPERGECFGDRARRHLTTLLEDGDASITALAGRDQYGRLLAYVTAAGVDVNEAMLEEGMAIALQTDHGRNAGYVATAERAAAAGIGLWSPTACGPASGADLTIGRIEHDPAGPDGSVLNDEFVELVNDGDSPVALTGWTLRDESSQNRLVLSGPLEAGSRLTVHTGCGIDDAQTVYWCSELPVWSNEGDTVFVLDPNGNIVAWKSYP